MASLLWIIAVAMVIWGIVSLMSGAAVAGIALIVAALVVGPAGARVLHI